MSTDTPQVKRNQYLVRVENKTRAYMRVFANSEQEAFEIADRDMKQSMQRQIENAVPHEFVQQLEGAAWAVREDIKHL